MLHWVPPTAVAFAGAKTPAPVLPGDTKRCVQTLRSMHALMLAYAAQRRRAAADPADSRYWKALEAHALEKARAIRAHGLYPRLP